MAQYLCPNCGDGGELATIEKIYAHAHLNKVTEEEGLDQTGETDVDWDSSETVGIYCGSCGWDRFTLDGEHITAHLQLEETEEEEEEEEPAHELLYEDDEDEPVNTVDDEHLIQCCPMCGSEEDWEYVEVTDVAKCDCGAEFKAA